MKVYDLTHEICPDMPVYPGTEPPTLTTANTYEKDLFQETLLTMFSHTGTHIDPPAHIFEGKMTLDSFPPEQFIGTALVIDCTALSEGESITMATLAPYGEDVARVDFLLFYTGYDRYWGTEAYFGSFPCIDGEVLELILRGNYKGIGFDTISLDPMESLVRHRQLFSQKNILNIENLCNLGALPRSPVMFACLPIKVQDSDGAPARAIAWEL